MNICMYKSGCCWPDEIIQLRELAPSAWKCIFSPIQEIMTDRQTDLPTDRATYGQSGLKGYTTINVWGE